MSDSKPDDPLSDFSQPDADLDPDTLEAESEPMFPERDYGVSDAEGETAAEEDAETPERDD